MPTLLRMATPFHWPLPWWTLSYPSAENAMCGKLASDSLVSCMQTMSGSA